jgi:hypothetical protein
VKRFSIVAEFELRSFPQVEFAARPSALRVLTVLLIIVDTLRRLSSVETRPVDIVMLVIEALILALIVAEFIWKVVDWRKARTKRKHYEAEIGELLSRLNEQEACALQELVLNETPLKPLIYNEIKSKSSPLLVRDALLGLNVNPDHREHIRQWAAARKKRELPKT